MPPQAPPRKASLIGERGFQEFLGTLTDATTPSINRPDERASDNAHTDVEIMHDSSNLQRSGIAMTRQRNSRSLIDHSAGAGVDDQLAVTEPLQMPRLLKHQRHSQIIIPDCARRMNLRCAEPDSSPDPLERMLYQAAATHSPMIRNHWLGKLANLNVARTDKRGIAPHKPLMLLTVIDLIESGDIPNGCVRYDVRLVSRFRDYWELVQDRQRNAPDIPMPFNALGSDQVWQRFTTDGHPSKSKLTTRLCHLDPDLFICLQDSNFRRKARETFVSIYFTDPEQIMLCARLGLPMPNTESIASLRADATAFKASQKKGRNSRFKSDVLGGYYFTCALTGYRLDTETGSIVQAAHIHQHAVSGNDDPRNGLALTPDAHWMFDAGLWTVIPKGDDLLIHVASGSFSESSPLGHSLSRYHKHPLKFHEHARLRPAHEHFKWHHKVKFLKRTR